ncbi:MAG: NAD(P)H-hydrate dehydratase [Candidatus Marinimicrobia bacterium]|nr:NAD(P)H-hydrate dehydratase [Candidatus Neomarinimicrobiota bacterium]
MIPVLTREAAYALDRDTIESGYLSENELMHNAGKSIAQFIIENVKDPFNQKFNIIAGVGNNGGDAIIAHAYLLEYEANSSLFLINKTQFTDDLVKKYRIPEDKCNLLSEKKIFDTSEWYLDGIIGIGLNRKIEGKYATVLEQLSLCSNIISIDIPSGIIANTGIDAGYAIQAQCTLTMGNPKLGHFFNTGKDYTGILEILDIGFKLEAVSKENIQLIEIDDIRDRLHAPMENTHKYKQGKLLLICGSKGYAGAALLTAQGAIKSGTGIAKMIIPESLYAIIENNVPEVITLPVPEFIPGSLSLENAERVTDELTWSDAMVFGSGLTMDMGENQWKAKILKETKIPLVLDAAGFLPLAEGNLSISELPDCCVLTPHYNEFAQIFKMDKESVTADPIKAVKNIISILEGRVLVLKGPTTIIVTSTGDILLNDHGNSLLATAGTGDVLSGVIGALLSNGYNSDDAAIIGTWLHGECAQQFSAFSSSKGLIASDLPYFLPAAWDSIQHVY